MGIVIRQSIKSSIVSYSGIVIGAITYLWFFPKYLNTQEIGIIRFVQDTAIMLGAIFQFSATNILIRYMPYFEQRGRFFNFILLYPLPANLLLLLVLIVFKDNFAGLFLDKSPEVLPYYHFILLLIFVFVYIMITEAYSKANFRIVVPTFNRTILVKISTIVFVVLYLIGTISFNQLVVALIVIYSFVLLLNLLYLNNLNLLSLGFVRPSKKMFNDIIVYGLFSIIGVISMNVINKIDVLMIGSMIGMDALGVFAITFFMGSIIEVPTRSITQVTAPIIAKHLKQNDIQGIQDIYKKSSINLVLAGFILFFLIWCNVDIIFMVMPNTEVYKAGKYVILFIGLAKVIDMSTGPNSQIIGFSSFYKVNLMINAILAAALVVTNFWLIPVYGITGAAIGTFLSMILFNLIKYIFLKIKLKLDPFDKNYLKAILINVTVFLIVINITITNIWLQSVIRSIMIVIGILLPTYLLKLSPEFNSIVHTLLRKLKQ